MTLVFWWVLVLALVFYLYVGWPEIKVWWYRRKIRKDIKEMESNNERR